MKRIYKTIVKTIFIIGLILLPKTSFADEFKSIDMDISIDKDGIASVSETWNIDEDNKDYTERYKLIENLKGLKIEDFSLSANGKDFEKIEPWDTDKSFEEKSYKYGRIDRNDEVELCWGISSYTDNTYTLKYKINPLVIGLNDADMVFFQFVGSNFDPKPENVSIKINGYEKFPEDTKMWGFGLVGEINNENGTIVLKSKGEVDYTTIMLKFPKGYFNTSYREDKSFKDYADKAVVDSKWEEKEGSVDTEPIPLFVKVILAILPIAVLSGIFAGIRGYKLNFDENNIINDNRLKKAKSYKNEFESRIPYEGNIEDLYFLLNRAYPYEVSPENFIDAFILKWIYDKNINLTEDKHPKIEIISRPKNMGQVEEEFFDIVEESIEYSKDGLVSEKNIAKYFRKNKEEVEDFYDNFIDSSKNALIENGYLKEISYQKQFLNTKKSGTELEVTDKGINLYEHLIKFKNYLLDYENVEKRNPEEINTWDMFIIYAAIFGISEKVFAKFENTYPEFYTRTYFAPYMIRNSRSFSKKTSTSYSNATGFSSAGGGGTTSFSGGGGSFGGGGGGGR
ncbi:DUF2207 domain-containing protein [uncultured Anaerococcus sp.]|uniref:DUF2207 family protein n=1 Tax=uncultured Anaerococcus sp. TaxID=293428 RepID=UPI00280AD9AE|nr:DUF2207 domain-containing protein [uncultured Anaerococcus sp.]MDU5149614.1 DUF2207 domain-containing protein [Anaerococcus prevotii]